MCDIYMFVYIDTEDRLPVDSVEEPLLDDSARAGL